MNVDRHRAYARSMPLPGPPDPPGPAGPRRLAGEPGDLRGAGLAVARRAGPRGAAPGHARRRAGRSVGRGRAPGGRRRLADGRLGAQPDRPRAGARRARRAGGDRGRPRHRRGRRGRRLALLRAPVHGRPVLRWTQRAGVGARRARRPWGAPPARLRAQPRRPRPPVGARAPWRVRARQRRRSRHPPRRVRRHAGGPDRPGPRSALPAVDRRRAARPVLTRGSPARRHDLARHRRAVRRRALRHGDAPARRRGAGHVGEPRAAIGSTSPTGGRSSIA